MLGRVLVIVVAIVVTYITAGAASNAFLAAWGSGAASAASVAGGVVGAAVGSAAGQGVAIGIGLQDRFSWESVGAAALTVGILQGTPLGSIAGQTADVGSQLLQGAINNAVGQGVNIALGLQESFSWRAVAASAVAAPIAVRVGNAVGPDDNGRTMIGARLWSGLTTQAIRAAFVGGKVDYAQIAADAFGIELGNSLAERLVGASTIRPATRAAQNSGDRSAAGEGTASVADGSPLSSNTSLRNGASGAVTSPDEVRSGLGNIYDLAPGYGQEGLTDLGGMLVTAPRIRPGETLADVDTQTRLLETLARSELLGRVASDNASATMRRGAGGPQVEGDSPIGLTTALTGATFFAEYYGASTRSVTTTSTLRVTIGAGAEVLEGNLAIRLADWVIRSRAREVTSQTKFSKTIESPRTHGSEKIIRSPAQLRVTASGAEIEESVTRQRVATSTTSINPALARAGKVLGGKVTGGVLEVGLNYLEGDYSLYDPTEEDIFVNYIAVGYDAVTGAAKAAGSTFVGVTVGSLSVLSVYGAPAAVAAGTGAAVVTDIGLTYTFDKARPQVLQLARDVYPAYSMAVDFTSRRVIEPLFTHPTFTRVVGYYNATVDYASRNIVEPVFSW